MVGHSPIHRENRTVKAVLAMILILLVICTGVFFLGRPAENPGHGKMTAAGEHVYATWDTMEFDKCVAAWLIVRFIDKDAEFVFCPVGTAICEGTVFDVPQAEWRRKHRKCTSDCVLESLSIDEPAVKKIVAIAHQIELNYWRYQGLSEASKCQNDFQEISSQMPDPHKCLERMLIYLDNLYQELSSLSEHSCGQSNQ